MQVPHWPFHLSGIETVEQPKRTLIYLLLPETTKCKTIIHHITVILNGVQVFFQLGSFSGSLIFTDHLKGRYYDHTDFDIWRFE